MHCGSHDSHDSRDSHDSHDSHGSHGGSHGSLARRFRRPNKSAVWRVELVSGKLYACRALNMMCVLCDTLHSRYEYCVTRYVVHYSVVWCVTYPSGAIIQSCHPSRSKLTYSILRLQLFGLPVLWCPVPPTLVNCEPSERGERRDRGRKEFCG